MFTCQVFIGTNLDQAAITAALDASLATDAEAAKLWKKLSATSHGVSRDVGCRVLREGVSIFVGI